jgi:dienelactone hydrolase
MWTIRITTVFVVLLAATSLASGQSTDGGLPRRAWLGVALGPHERGAVVTSVVEGSSAAASGIRAGDVIRAVDGAAIQAPADVIAAVGRRAAGDSVSLEIIRENTLSQWTVGLRPVPRESLPGVTFEYGAVGLDDGSRLRTIVSVPDGAVGRFPAVMLIQGGGCGSVDVPMAPDVAQPGLIRTIAVQGFGPVRVEKSGIGDSRGPACDAIGYLQELEGYRAALRMLKQRPSVDVAQVFILGISLGGVFAPTLANETPIRGIVVYGTPAGPPSPYPGRSERFFREFASADIARAWSSLSSRVLVLHGEFDEMLADTDHVERIVAAVNAGHPGTATHMELRGLDHSWTRHESREKSRGRAGQGEEVSTFSDAVLSFLRSARDPRSPR